MKEVTAQIEEDCRKRSRFGLDPEEGLGPEGRAAVRDVMVAAVRRTDPKLLPKKIGKSFRAEYLAYYGLEALALDLFRKSKGRKTKSRLWLWISEDPVTVGRLFWLRRGGQVWVNLHPDASVEEFEPSYYYDPLESISVSLKEGSPNIREVRIGSLSCNILVEVEGMTYQRLRKEPGWFTLGLNSDESRAILSEVQRGMEKLAGEVRLERDELPVWAPLRRAADQEYVTEYFAGSGESRADREAVDPKPPLLALDPAFGLDPEDRRWLAELLVLTVEAVAPGMLLDRAAPEVRHQLDDGMGVEVLALALANRTGPPTGEEPRRVLDLRVWIAAERETALRIFRWKEASWMKTSQHTDPDHDPEPWQWVWRDEGEIDVGERRFHSATAWHFAAGLPEGHDNLEPDRIGFLRGNVVVEVEGLTFFNLSESQPANAFALDREGYEIAREIIERLDSALVHRSGPRKAPRAP